MVPDVVGLIVSKAWCRSRFLAILNLLPMRLLFVFISFVLLSACTGFERAELVAPPQEQECPAELPACGDSWPRQCCIYAYLRDRDHDGQDDMAVLEYYDGAGAHSRQETDVGIDGVVDYCMGATCPNARAE